MWTSWFVECLIKYPYYKVFIFPYRYWFDNKNNNIFEKLSESISVYNNAIHLSYYGTNNLKRTTLHWYVFAWHTFRRIAEPSFGRCIKRENMWRYKVTHSQWSEHIGKNKSHSPLGWSVTHCLTLLELTFFNVTTQTNSVF